MATYLPTSTIRSYLPSQGSGERPIIARTDGNRLILKGVRFEDGKKYDISIWRWDSEGEQISVDENTPFSAAALSQIQEIAAKNIFKHYQDPSQVKIIYNKDPEWCVSENDHADVKQVDLIENRDDEIVDGAREIHELLSPHMIAEVTDHPLGSLVIQPKFMTSDELAELSRSEEEVFATNDDPYEVSPDSQYIPLSFCDASTSTDPIPSNPTTTSSSSATSAAPLPAELRRDLIQSIDSKSAEFLRKKQLPFLKDVTYSQLAQYSNLPEKQEKDKLFPIYHVFKKVIETPTESDDDDHTKEGQMSQWINALYSAAYYHYQEYLNHFNINDKTSWGGSFHEWCKHYAANSVLGFIRVEGTSYDAMVDVLKRTDPPPLDDLLDDLEE